MVKFRLRQLKIKQRLLLLTLLSSCLMLFPLLMMLSSYQNDLMQAKQVKTQHLIETVTGILSYYHQQEQQGALSLEQAQQRAKNTLAMLRYGQEDYFWINDLTPTMVMHPMNPSLDGRELSSITDPNGKAIFVEMVNVVRKSGQGPIGYMWSKPGSDAPVDKISYVKNFVPWGWVVGSGIYIDDVNALLWAHTKQSLILLISTLFVLFLIAHWISQSITKPCQATQIALTDIANGDGDLTRTLPVTGNDELAHIALAFNQFAAKIRHIVQNIQPITQDVTGAAQELTQVAHHASNKAHEQHSSVQNVASAMSQLCNSNMEVTGAAQQAEQFARKASEISLSSSKAIVMASDYMGTLAETVSRTEKNVQELAQDSQKVEAVLDVIRGVAEQTNLLALNAAIEAARAGEQGRGFAVVADEVRTLATRTRNSTDEIEQIIINLQKRACDVSQSMSKTQSQSLATQEQANQAQQALHEIGVQIEEILELNQHIAKASNEHAKATESIRTDLDCIAHHSDSNITQANQIAAASEQLMHNGQQLKTNFAAFKV